MSIYHKDKASYRPKFQGAYLSSRIAQGRLSCITKEMSDRIPTTDYGEPLVLIVEDRAKVERRGYLNELLVGRPEALHIVYIKQKHSKNWCGSERKIPFGYIWTESIEVNVSPLELLAAQSE